MKTRYTIESYAGTYKLLYLANGWKTLLRNGSYVGSTNMKGGTYTIANYFKV